MKKEMIQTAVIGLMTILAFSAGAVDKPISASPKDKDLSGDLVRHFSNRLRASRVARRPGRAKRRFVFQDPRRIQISSSLAHICRAHGIGVR